MTEKISFRDWRKQHQTTASVALPYSGLTVEVGHVRLDELLINGAIPDLLTGVVASVLWATVGQAKEEEIRAQKDFYALVNVVVTAALVTPRVVENPTADDEIAITDLDFGDKIMVYTIATQPLGVLHRFRQEQTPTMDALPEGQNVQPATE